MKKTMKALKDLDPEQTAKELISINFSSSQYENGVQADRKRQLETFKKFNVEVLINMSQELIKFGEDVLKILRSHEENILKNKG